jgi:hypothetical protein
VAVYNGFLDCEVVVVVRFVVMLVFVLMEEVGVVMGAVVEVGIVTVGSMETYRECVGWLVERSMVVEGLEGDGR